MSLRHKKPNAQLWFQEGQRIYYNPVTKKINDKDPINSLFVWANSIKIEHQYLQEWATMMPGFPDGSFGWAATEQLLKSQKPFPRLYVDYVGMGDSDKPSDYSYSVMERADLIEALWQHYNIKETILITFDFSSLVALELLSRQLENQQGTKINKVLMINGGYFADSHSHPILTTPLLKTLFGKLGTKVAQRSKFAFNLMLKDLWSVEYGITEKELTEIRSAITRRDGAVFMSNAARFVDEHKQNSDRWDLKRIYLETYPKIKYMIASSEKDQFEPKQFIKAKNELEALGLVTEMYPGGHMTTSEYPELIAKSIEGITQ